MIFVGNSISGLSLWTDNIVALFQSLGKCFKAIFNPRNTFDIEKPSNEKDGKLFLWNLDTRTKVYMPIQIVKFVMPKYHCSAILAKYELHNATVMMHP